ncbi:hypothetical protein J0X12_16135 [Sneathiella sp. CAU 1612]|jgi:hypothetical protein|uniref:Uncharacterized protein n=1 Tax=Sneathiella sedimenti TaxID=2816034 RepID=A0ABS3F9E4_9PROT|nr:hypothetical protein [Sneathiella sedimenti]MBO0335152.1 hypothetical protein [Sneathiella sedimenti]
MLSDISKKILGFIGIALVATFVLGLAFSISSGFAGFWGGLPFWIVSLFVLSMAVYNYWEETLRKK